MEIRLGSVLLIAALLSGCSWFHRGDAKPPAEIVAEAPAGDPSIIDPQVQRRKISTPKIKAKDFEVGAYVGALSIQDFGTNPIYGLRGAYHLTEDLFLEGFAARSKAGTTSLQDVLPNVSVAGSGSRLSYYDIDLGYNVLPGEVFLGRGRAYNIALYTLVGMGAVRFADQDKFSINFGAGTRILLTNWLATHFDIRDHVLSTDVTGRVKNVHDIEATVGFTFFY